MFGRGTQAGSVYVAGLVYVAGSVRLLVRSFVSFVCPFDLVRFDLMNALGVVSIVLFHFALFAWMTTGCPGHLQGEVVILLLISAK